MLTYGADIFRGGHDEIFAYEVTWGGRVLHWSIAMDFPRMKGIPDQGARAGSYGKGASVVRYKGSYHAIVGGQMPLNGSHFFVRARSRDGFDWALIDESDRPTDDPAEAHRILYSDSQPRVPWHSALAVGGDGRFYAWIGVRDPFTVLALRYYPDGSQLQIQTSLGSWRQFDGEIRQGRSWLRQHDALPGIADVVSILVTDERALLVGRVREGIIGTELVVLESLPGPPWRWSRDTVLRTRDLHGEILGVACSTGAPAAALMERNGRLRMWYQVGIRPCFGFGCRAQPGTVRLFPVTD